MVVEVKLQSKDTTSMECPILYLIAHGKSLNPTVTLEADSIPITLHLDTQGDVTVNTDENFKSLKSTRPLQPINAAIRSSFGMTQGLSPRIGWLLPSHHPQKPKMAFRRLFAYSQGRSREHSAPELLSG